MQINFDIVIRWLTSNETTTLPMVPLICDCRARLSRAWTVLPRHIFRETNNIADGLAKRGVMQRNSLVKYAQCPTFVINPYIWDLLKKKEKALPEYLLTSLNTRLHLEMTNRPIFITTT